MNKKLLIAECLGAIFIFLIGTVIHFGFEWTNKISLFSFLFAVNESIWEHIKLNFWAPLIYGLIEYFIVGKGYNNFFIAKTSSALITSICMVLIYYLVTSIAGPLELPGHLIIYEIAIIIGLIASYNIIKLPPLPKFLNYISLFIIIAAADIFYIFSYNPPKLPIFKDALTGGYGAYHKI